MVPTGEVAALGQTTLALKKRRPIRVDRSREYWTPDRRWEGDTAFILGGGGSLRGFDCSRLRGSGWVMAINSSFKTAPFCDALYFNDFSWFTGKSDGKPRRKLIEASDALVVTTSRQAKGAAPDRLKLLKMSPTSSLSGLRQGRSSGQSGISIAAAFGAKRIVLLGFDMRRIDGRSHHHDEYGSASDRLYSHDFIPAFAGWNAAAKQERIEILNATPGSALREFPSINVEEILK